MTILSPEQIDDWNTLLPQVLAAVRYSYEAGDYPGDMSPEVARYCAGDGGLLSALSDAIDALATARAYHDLRDAVLALADDQGPGTSYLVVGYQRRIREAVARVEGGES